MSIICKCLSRQQQLVKQIRHHAFYTVPALNIVHPVKSAPVRCLSSEQTVPETSYRVGRIVGTLQKSLHKFMIKGLVPKNLYECCADHVRYEEFFKVCDMPDTMQSWFFVMQLHVWMLLVRLKACGREGKNASYKMVDMMWKDIAERVKLMGVSGATDKNDVMDDLTRQFFGLIVAYDEGLISHDIVLASALWRNLFSNKEQMNAENLAKMVEYVRKQVQHLEQINDEDLLVYGKLDWLPLLEEQNK